MLTKEKLRSQANDKVDADKIIDEINGLEDGSTVISKITFADGSIRQPLSEADFALLIDTSDYIYLHSGFGSINMLDDGIWFSMGEEALVIRSGKIECLKPLAITSSTTANRPLVAIIGMCHFDTTLGKPIWCKEATPSVVWVDATGATV